MLNRALMLSLCLVASQCVMAADSSKIDGKVPTESRQMPAAPPLKEVPIDPKLQAAARAELKAALASEDGMIRGHALEAQKQLLGEKAKDDIVRSLADTEPRVRFAAAMAVGDLKLASVKDDVVKLVDDNDVNVRIAVRYALHRLGDYRFSHDLERTAVDQDMRVRSNTAMVLGKIEGPSALKLLMPMRRDVEASVRLQVAEALLQHGDERGLKTLVAASVSAYPDDVMIAYTAMAATKDQKLIGHVQAGLNNDYPEIALASARAMGELGSDMGYGVALMGAKSKMPLHRYLGALALGTIGRSDSQEVLESLLHDKESPDIRLAAAFALLQLKGK